MCICLPETVHRGCSGTASNLANGAILLLDSERFFPLRPTVFTA